ncbi:D-tyrosyl-tRNA(Tyr) deacylase [Dimargaris xerosporica]|nr:D-tyrosyl-tRNA(Tyr) deacylase [Dimargaris xerosporica]
MRAVIQRVTEASVAVNGEVISSIGKGLCVLIGITHEDEAKDIDYMVRKVLNLRLFDDETGKMWRKSAKDLGLEILSVSQFTLYAKAKGNKPDFHCAMPGSASKDYYHTFLEQLRAAYDPTKIKDGEFGAMMSVNIVNDGPVTIQLDSRQDK